MSKKAAMTSLAQGLQPQVSYHRRGSPCLKQLREQPIYWHGACQQRGRPQEEMSALCGSLTLLSFGIPPQSERPEHLSVLCWWQRAELCTASPGVADQLQGDMIPWTISQQYQDPEFPALSGARVVRIAAHPDMRRAGYGSRVLELLRRYYEGDLADLVRLLVSAQPRMPLSIVGGQSEIMHCSHLNTHAPATVATVWHCCGAVMGSTWQSWWGGPSRHFWMYQVSQE